MYTISTATKKTIANKCVQNCIVQVQMSSKVDNPIR